VSIASVKLSSRDLPGQMTMKQRQEGQGTEEEIKAKDLKAELEEKERRHYAAKKLAENRVAPSEVESSAKPLTLTAAAVPESIPNMFPQDADDEPGDVNDSDEEEEDDDDDEEEAELRRELEKIKREREEEERSKREAEGRAEEEARREQVLRSNPLMTGADVSVKRRWDDDVVFKNQAKGAPKAQKRFINDVVRSEFHRKFMNKYII